MSEHAALVAAALVGAAVFLVIALAVAGLLGPLIVPELIGLSSDEIARYQRLSAFTSVVAGFAGAVSAGIAAHLVSQRLGLEGRHRPAAIVAAPLVLGTAWLLFVDPGVGIFFTGLALYLLGAALGAMLAGLRRTPQVEDRPAERA